jgi:hypothetical protein
MSRIKLTYRNEGVIVINKKFWEELINYFSLTRHRPHRKKYAFNSSIVAVTFLPEPLLSNDREMQIQTRRLMGEICGIRLLDGPRCYDIHTEFSNDRFRHSEVDWGGGIHRHTESMVIS